MSKDKERLGKILSQHLYSVHKPLADLESLASSDSDDWINCGAIKSDVWKKRTEEEMEILLWGGPTLKKVTIEEDVTILAPINSMNSSSRIEESSVTAKKNDCATKRFTKGKAKKGKKISHGRKRKRTKETDEIPKKREERKGKKILVVHIDSSDTESYIETKEESVISETNPETLAKLSNSSSPRRVIHEDGKRKMLKLDRVVDRVYTGDDYTVRRKEYVNITCSKDKEEMDEIFASIGRRAEIEIEKRVEIEIEKAKGRQSKVTDFFERL